MSARAGLGQLGGRPGGFFSSVGTLERPNGVWPPKLAEELQCACAPMAGHDCASHHHISLSVTSHAIFSR